MKKEDEGIKLLSGGLALLYIVIKPFIEGFVVSIVWNWYMSPIFGLQNLTIIHGFSISLLVGYLIMNPRRILQKFTADERIDTIVFDLLTAPALILTYAWIFKHWI